MAKRQAEQPVSPRVEKVARTSSEPPPVESKYKKEDMLLNPQLRPPAFPEVCASELMQLHGETRILYDIKNEFFREPPFPRPWPQVPTHMPGAPHRWFEPGDRTYIRYITDLRNMFDTDPPRLERWGICWEVYNIDEKNVANIKALVPDTTKVISDDDDVIGIRVVSTTMTSRSRIAVFHLGRVSWELTRRSFPAGFLANSNPLSGSGRIEPLLDLIIQYVDGTNLPIVSIRRDHRRNLVEKNQLPQYGASRSAFMRIIVQNNASFGLAQDVRTRLCQGRVPIGMRGRLQTDEINIIGNMADLMASLTRSDPEQARMPV